VARRLARSQLQQTAVARSEHPGDWYIEGMPHGRRGAMDTAEDQIGFLRTRLAAGIVSFRRRRVVNRRAAFALRIAVTSFGSLTTILRGLRGNALFSDQDNIFSAMALIMSAAVTIASTWETFFDHRWLWIQYTDTLTNLYRISDELEYVTAGNKPVPPERLEALFQQLQDTFQQANVAWSGKRRRENEDRHGSKA
jgi:hypothetical protein